MDDMQPPAGPHDGPDEHPAGTGGSGVGPVDGPVDGDGRADVSGEDPTSPDANRIVDPEADLRLTAFLERTSEVLRTRPDEFTAHRHLTAMRTAAAETTRRGRQPVARFATIAAAAVIAATVTLAGFGALPAPAQQVMSEVADRLGFAIPSPDTDSAPPAETPSKRLPVPETVPGQPGGPDRSELPGLREDGVLRTPGRSDGTSPPGQNRERTPPGQQDRTPPGQQDRTPPGQQDRRTPPGLERDDVPPGQDEDFVPPGQNEDTAPPGPPDRPDRPETDRSPGPPDQPPGTDPPGPPDPPEPPSPPPAHGRDSGVPGDEPSTSRPSAGQDGQGRPSEGGGRGNDNTNRAGSDGGSDRGGSGGGPTRP